MEIKVNQKEAKLDQKDQREVLLKDLKILSVAGFKNLSGDMDVVKTKHLAKNFFSNPPPIFNINDVIRDTDFTPLMCATWVENLKLINILIDNGAEVLGNNKDLPSAIHIAVAKNNVELMEKFLNKSPILINHQDKTGTTPLMLAAELKNPEIMKFLLDKEADISLKNKDGKDVKEIAQENLNGESVQWLNNYMLRKKMAEQDLEQGYKRINKTRKI